MSKKDVILGIILVLVLSVSFSAQASDVLKILIWPNYYSPEVMEDFERENGVKIEFTFVATYTEMMQKIVENPGEYDVLVTGEYSIPSLIKKNMLLPLQKDKLSNFKNLDPWFTNLAFDPGNKYTIPYHYIFFGLAYNKKMLKPEDVSLQTFFETPENLKGKIITYPDPRINIGFALKYIGKSINSTNSEDLELVKMLLQMVKSNATGDSWDINRTITQPAEAIIKGDAYIAIYYAFEHFPLFKQYSDIIGYKLPEEGGVFGMDNLAIVSGTKNVELAHKFLNYMMEPEVAAKSVEYLGIPSAVQGVRELIRPELANNFCIYPPLEIAKNYEFLKPLTDEETKFFFDLWESIK